MRQNLKEEQRIFDSISYESIYSEDTYREIIGYFKAKCPAALLNPGRKLQIADIGCGQADFGIRFAQEIGRPQITGLDLSMNLLRRIKSPLVNKVRANALELPFDNGAVDILIAAAIIHHFPDYPRLLGEFHRVLSDGGALLVFEPNGNSIKERSMYALGRYFHSRTFTKNEFPLRPARLLSAVTHHGFRKTGIIPVKVRYRDNLKRTTLGRIFDILDRLNPLPYSNYPFYLLSGICVKDSGQAFK